MSAPIEILRVTALAADRGEVWRSVSTMSGVNFELHPVLHMTSPRQVGALPTEAASGTVLFRSWLLLFGVVPFDRHALALDHVEDGFRFVEQSTSWSQRRWRHERTLTALHGGGCSVADRLVIEPRFRIGRPLVAAFVRRLFRHRHRRLAQRFGTTRPTPQTMDPGGLTRRAPSSTAGEPPEQYDRAHVDRDRVQQLRHR